jgi:hypothetical protein
MAIEDVKQLSLNLALTFSERVTELEMLHYGEVLNKVAIGAS